MNTKILKKIDHPIEKEDNNDYTLMLEKHKKKLERLSKKTKKDIFSGKQKIAGECARRIRILRNALDLTAIDMAQLCNFNPSKYTRLENGTTILKKDDAIAMCIALLKRYQLVIETEWLLGKISQTPASLINLERVQQQVTQYTDTFLDKSVSENGIRSTVSIFLEIEQLGRIHKTGTKFIMVNDNRLLPEYKKGDYVGGMIVPRNLWSLLKGYTCIVELRKDEKVCVRNVYVTEQANNMEYVILTTNTREPELVPKESILSIAVIFYHRYNGEDLVNILDVIHQYNNSNDGTVHEK